MSSIYSKVILSGEHSVLRGGLAVVAPFRKYDLTYSYENFKAFELVLSDKVKPYEILIQGTLERALSVLGKTLEDLQARISIESVVPLGKGLGGSAALCVFISRVMLKAGWVEEKELFSFSKELENIFHGESSGVDIAGCVSSQIQSYIRGEVPKIFAQELSPYLYLSSTDEVGSTEECIEKVLSLKAKDSNKFYDLDEEMNQASNLVLSGLSGGNPKEFNEGLLLGASVFKSWGLYTDKMKNLEGELTKTGAQAVKPTGSGMGGFMLSSWSKRQKLEDLPIGSLELEL